ncbi:hypothetical protein B0H66DRAFT_220405 [Apodospora peruviana]|uniref:Uncharacterized protein n=1 Tax=Apodospora peruviana TaxID=516989 RepID=A0AAE0I3L5_9PEZI|nr:hypothetical protein B0H66DRAFT_220405 [Apodospora peruviana]
MLILHSRIHLLSQHSKLGMAVSFSFALSLSHDPPLFIRSAILRRSFMGKCFHISSVRLPYLLLPVMRDRISLSRVPLFFLPFSPEPVLGSQGPVLAFPILDLHLRFPGTINLPLVYFCAVPCLLIIIASLQQHTSSAWVVYSCILPWLSSAGSFIRIHRHYLLSLIKLDA